MLRTIISAIMAVTVLFGGGAREEKKSINKTLNLYSAEMPFFDLRPELLTVRSKFYTSYSKSSEDRKHNIALAAKSLNNTFVDVGGEFSFNRTVGARTEKRGYRTAKIIVDGKFVDGVGGGVCQVSTTLYNAVLLAGLEITEFHPHSLPVSYVAPSFDAMVNSGNADLRFINNTHNPVIIQTVANGETLTVKIIGEPLRESIVRESVITEYIPIPEEEVIFDTEGKYPDLYVGERKVIAYGKQGYKSEGYLVRIVNGKKFVSKIRRDKYAAMRGIIVEGTAVPPKESIENPDVAE